MRSRGLDECGSLMKVSSPPRAGERERVLGERWPDMGMDERRTMYVGGRPEALCTRGTVKDRQSRKWRVEHAGAGVSEAREDPRQ